MVNRWDQKFAIERDGKVYQYKMAHGGLLFRNGKPTSLDWFNVGQEVMMMVQENDKNSFLISASLLPHQKASQAAGKAKKQKTQEQAAASSKDDVKAQKRAEKEAKKVFLLAFPRPNVYNRSARLNLPAH